MFNKILLPVDGSISGKKSWEYAKKLIKDYNVNIEVLYVNDDIWLDTEERKCEEGTCETINILQACDMDELEEISNHRKRKKAQMICKIQTDLKDYFKEYSDNITMKVVNGNPAHQIVTIAKKDKFDLILICSHGMGAIKRFTLGGVTNKVVQHSDVPVLVVKK